MRVAPEARRAGSWSRELNAMPIIGVLIVVGAIAFALWWFFGRGNNQRAQGSDMMELRQAENKVKVSDPILRRDIDILDRYGSDLLQEAIELRHAQLLKGDHPESHSC